MTEDSPKRRRGRPKKDQAGHSETKAALLRAGMEILTERGFCATGIEVILRQVNVPKGSFYHYFKSKEDYGLALLESYSNYLQTQLNRALQQSHLSGLERLQQYMLNAAEAMQRHQFARGCLVGNLSQEVAQLPPCFRQKLSGVLADWQQLVTECLELAKAQQEIAADSDCQQLAYVFWNGWEGAVMRAKLEHSTRPLTAFSDFYVAAIKQ